MKFTENGWAQRAVLLWVSLYTWGLPHDLRDRRRAEIESDLSKQEQDAVRSIQTNRNVVLGTANRLARGISADLSWRIDLLFRSSYAGQEGGLKNGPEGQTFIGIAGLMAACTRNPRFLGLARNV